MVHQHRLVIRATPAQVWATLVDFEHWSAWNTLAAEAPDGLHVGARFIVTVDVRGRPFHAKARFLRVEPERALVWRGGLPGLFRATHGFVLEPHPEGCSIVHSEHFRGALTPLVLRVSGTGRPETYRLVNEGLERHLAAAR